MAPIMIFSVIWLSKKLLSPLVHLNYFSPLWVLWLILRLKLKNSWHTWCTEMFSLLCGSSHVSSQVTRFWEALTTHCALEWLLKYYLCVFSPVFSRSLVQKLIKKRESVCVHVYQWRRARRRALKTGFDFALFLTNGTSWSGFSWLGTIFGL